jgi:hypothetical protein
MMEILTHSIIGSFTVGSKSWASAPYLFPANEEKHIKLDSSTVDNTERVHSGFLHTTADHKILDTNVPGIYNYFTTGAVITQVCPMSLDCGSNVINVLDGIFNVFSPYGNIDVPDNAKKG